MKEHFDIQFFNIGDQVITAPINYFIELEEEFIYYSIAMYCEEKDEETGIREERFRSQQSLVRKRDVSAITKYYNKKHDQWIVDMDVIGVADPFELHYKTEDEATEMFIKLMKWLKKN